MGEVIKSCCYCCCTCYQSGLCCASVCCVVLPIVGLLLVLAGIVAALLLGFTMIHHESKEHVVARLVTVLANLSYAAEEAVNGTGVANVVN